MLRAGDEIAFGAQTAAQPASGDSAKPHVSVFDVMARRFALSRGQQMRGVDEDEIAHGAFKLFDAHLAIAAAMALSDATAREPGKQRQEP